MARVTYVKSARQRYKQVAVLDANGDPKRTPVMRADGTQKVTKRGVAVFMAVTRDDKSQPLPPETCESCGKEILPGMAYKHVSPKSGPYGGSRRVRCNDCPGWQPWDLSNAWWARIQQATADFDVSNAETPDDVTAALEAVADSIRDLAQESEDTADNMEQGFGHSTMQSDEARDRAQALNDWADEIANAEVPELPEPEAVPRYFVVNNDGSGDVAEDTPEGFETEAEAQAYMAQIVAMYPQAEGDMSIEERDWTPDEPSEEQMDQWRSEVDDAVQVVSESPI